MPKGEWTLSQRRAHSLNQEKLWLRCLSDCRVRVEPRIPGDGFGPLLLDRRRGRLVRGGHRAHETFQKPGHASADQGRQDAERYAPGAPIAVVRKPRDRGAIRPDFKHGIMGSACALVPNSEH